MSVNEKMTDIADRLRGYAHKTDKLALEDMPSGVDKAFGQGFLYGVNFIINTWINKTEFWDVFQANGKRTDYSYAFNGDFFTEEMLKPKYSMKVSNAEKMFAQNGYLTSIDTTNIDFSECTNFYQTFAGASNATTIGAISAVNAPDLYATFLGDNGLVEIGVLTVSENTAFTSTFGYCVRLENITFAGTIGQSILLKQCPLNRASIENILDHLSTTSQGQTLTLKSGLVDTAFETSEGAGDGRAVFETLIADKTNWSFSY